MTIDGTIELVEQSTSLFSIGDIIAVIVALISLIGVIITTIITNQTTKKINKSNEGLQDKWNQKNIDATLTASARIEWIQMVRNTTSELIALYFKALNTICKKELLEIVIRAQEKTELLILYFGHEESEPNKQVVDMCDRTSNDSKNTLIVEFLSSLSKKLYRYYENVKSDKLKSLKEIRSQRYDKMQEYIVSYEHEEYTDEYGKIHDTVEPVLDEVYEESLNEIEAQINNLVKVSKDINNDILYLRDIIRIYLKIEWNKAKSGI